MTRWLVTSFIFSCAVLLVGCGTPVNQSATSKSHPTVSTVARGANRLTASDLKIGHLFIEQKLNSVRAFYDKPTITSIVHGNGAPQWNYAKKGFSVGGSPVFTIIARLGFSGSTPRGIHIGSTTERVKQAYPMAHWVQHHTQLFAQTPNHKFSIDFQITRGTVTTIVLTNNNP